MTDKHKELFEGIMLVCGSETCKILVWEDPKPKICIGDRLKIRPINKRTPTGRQWTKAPVPTAPSDPVETPRPDNFYTTTRKNRT